MATRRLDFTGARRPSRAPLDGRRVRLEPVDAACHAADLFAAAHGPGADPRLWDHLPYGPFAEANALAAWPAGLEASEDPLFLAVRDRDAERMRGMAAYLRIAPEHGSIEIGHIWFGAGLQRTPAATEAIFLLAAHAFDDLGNRRLEWKCDAANARSRRAAERFGFTFEGVFGQHMVVKGRNRDTGLVRAPRPRVATDSRGVRALARPDELRRRRAPAAAARRARRRGRRSGFRCRRRGEAGTMPELTQVGQAGLKGWRAKVGDAVAAPVAKRSPLDEDQVRAAVGGLFFVLATVYVVRTVATLVRGARGS